MESMQNHSPFRLTRILVPVDFSEPSRKALHYALSLAKSFNAQIRLLHVVEAVVFPPDTVVVEPAVLAARLNEEARRCLSAWRKEVASETVVKDDLRAGTPYREIIEAASETKSDLIVLGTHGRNGLTRLFIGSTAERVVRHAACPVLVVRDRQLEPEKAAKNRRSASSSFNELHSSCHQPH
jgi:universal stress protein A